MSQRLSSIAERVGKQQNRLEDWRQLHPLCRKSLRYALYGEKYSKIIDQVFDMLISNPHIFKHSNLEDFNRKQERKNGAEMVTTIHRNYPVKQDQYLKDMHVISSSTHAIYQFDPGLSVKCDISFFLYAKTIYFFASENPIQQKFVRQATNFQHVGCFGLTEINHGSNVKGILTEAIYDHQKKEFIINSPEEGAMKYWIGAAAELATMAIIWSQLVIDGKKYGPHPFIVPIRDPKTHKCYPGVTIGDCGHKNGLNVIDNGYMLFKNYRIPKDHGLNRISGVDQNGKFYNRTKSMERLFGSYLGPLSVGRAFVASNSLALTCNCLTIAIRFVCNRRQFGITDKKQQLLIDYPLMRNRLMPNLAQAFVYIFGGVNLLKLYDDNLQHLKDPNNKLVEQLHAITSPCKAKSSWFSTRVITQCRQVLAGHGYSSYSGLHRMYHGQQINNTWEGDNNMLLQQTTKYILKIVNRLSKGKPVDKNALSFLSESIEIQDNSSKQMLYDIDYLEKIVKVRIRQLAQECISNMIQQKSQGKNGMDIWNNAQPYFGNSLSLAYGDLYYLTFMKQALGKLDSKWKEIGENCIRLWIFTVLLDWKWGNVQTRKILQLSILELTEWLTPRSVSITDALSAPSQVIGSVFANEKGEGMKQYVTKLFTGKNVFGAVQWSDKLIKMRNQN